jgi:hypothetical protein
MINQNKILFEDANPNPEFLIKSIAEQGYSLETSLADLMDNSISADSDRIEVLIKMDEEPFTLFLADNGNGMDENELKEKMKFPSNSPDSKRDQNDLGRFGLGMKTASFAQTRCFTVISRKKGDTKYCARTWDVDFLKKNGWKIIINTQDEIDELIEIYKELSEGHLNKFQNFEANTIVVWKGLYKYENYLEEKNRQDALKKQLTEITTDYLSIVFHRFMEKEKFPLQIRINNKLVIPFNPFPINEKDFRPIEYKQKKFSTDSIKIEGFVLPSRSIDESQKGLSCWTTKNRGLMDMEGIYIYRADRIILFGGWNGLIKKAQRLQLARLRVDVGNSVDHLLHLNVAKSQIVIPYDLTNAFEKYIEELKIEAEREYYNRGIRKFSYDKKINNAQLFERKSCNKGFLLELNLEFPLLKSLRTELNKEQLSKLNLVLRMINTRINNIRQSQEDQKFVGIEDKDGMTLDEILFCINQLIENGLTPELIRKDILPNLGYLVESLPVEIQNIIK